MLDYLNLKTLENKIIEKTASVRYFFKKQIKIGPVFFICRLDRTSKNPISGLASINFPGNVFMPVQILDKWFEAIRDDIWNLNRRTS